MEVSGNAPLPSRDELQQEILDLVHIRPLIADYQIAAYLNASYPVVRQELRMLVESDVLRVRQIGRRVLTDFYEPSD